MGLWDVVEDAWDTGVDVVTTTVDAVGGAIGDAVEWVGGAAVTFTNAGIGFASAALSVPAEIVDKTGWVLKRIPDGVGGFYNDYVEPTVEDLAAAAETAATAATSWMSPAIEFAAEAASTAGGLALQATDWGLQQADTYVFDPIEVASGGLIDIDFQDGNLSAGIGAEGVLYTGGSIGTDGVSAQTDTVLGGGGGHIGPDGIGADGHVGSDFVPMPGAEAHVEVGPDGFAAGGDVDLTLPGGLGGGSVGAEITVDEEGNVDADVDAEGMIVTPVGTIDVDDLDDLHIPDELLPNPPSLDDLVPSAEDAFAQIPTDAPNLDDLLEAVPTPQDYIDQIPAAPDLDDLAGMFPSPPTSVGDVLAMDGLPTLELPTVDLPTVDLPTVDLPSVGFETLELPTLGTVDPFGNVDAGQLIDDIAPQLLDSAADQTVFQDFADAPVTAADIGSLAGSGDLSEVIALGDQDSPGDAIEAVAAYVEQGNFDDFTSDVVSAEVNEAAADAVWDGLA